MDGYWEEKARREAAEKDRLREAIEGGFPLGGRPPEGDDQEEERDPEPSGAGGVAPGVREDRPRD
jgi:hypothetical protein